MQKKKHLRCPYGSGRAHRVGCLFYGGLDTGRIINDEKRIQRELSSLSLYEPIELRAETKSETGRIELKVISDYLTEFREKNPF